MYHINKNSKSSFIFFKIITPILLGVIIYISFRSENIKFFYWFKYFKINEYINIWRDNANSIKENIKPWIRYSLPDGLWVYSFSATLYLIWSHKFQITKMLIISIPFVIFFTMEMLQYFNVINGTFDIMDILISFIMYMIFILEVKLKSNKLK